MLSRELTRQLEQPCRLLDADKISLSYFTCPEDPNSFEKPGKTELCHQCRIHAARPLSRMTPGAYMPSPRTAQVGMEMKRSMKSKISASVPPQVSPGDTTTRFNPRWTTFRWAMELPIR